LGIPSDLISLGGNRQTLDDGVGEPGGHVSTVSAAKCAYHVQPMSGHVQRLSEIGTAD
jgi:hypothetical protein